MKNVLLTFDIEEFDFSKNILKLPEARRYSISLFGLKKTLEILDKYNIKATFFVTANFALRYPKVIKQVSKRHEIASHGLEHKDDYILLKEKECLERIRKSKKIIERIIGKKIYGFRAPRFQFRNYKLLEKAGFVYDSSLHPTFMPGKYNNFFAKRKIFHKGKITEVPLSATPLFRWPIFWLAFRNLGLSYVKLCTRLCFTDNNYVMTLFHPWEFFNLHEFKLPIYIRRNSGKKLEIMIEKYIKWCISRGYRFLTIREHLKL